MSRIPNTNCSSCNKSIFSKNLNNPKIICNNCRKNNSIRFCSTCNVQTKNLKYCSKSCSAKQNNKIPKRKIIRTCSQCENIAYKCNSRLCKQHFEEKSKTHRSYIENLTLQDYTERDSIKRLHISSKFAHIRGLCRSWNKDKLKLPCYNCGYDKHVELAHIRALSSFPKTAKIKDVNSESNIVQLCPNCHWEFDNGKLDLKFP